MPQPAAPCALCNKAFVARSIRIACGKCAGVYHKACSKVSDDSWSSFADGSVLFNCCKCRASRRSSVIGAPPEAQRDASAQSSDLSALKDDIVTFNDALGSFKDTVRGVEASLTNLHDSMTSIEQRLAMFESRFKILDEVVEENTRLKNRLDMIEKRLATNGTTATKSRDLPKAQPTFQATISGVEKSDNESMDDILSKILTNLDPGIKNDVVKCHRMPKSNSVVVTTLKSRSSLENLIKAAKEKKPTADIVGGDGSTRIYINEILPTTCYKLLRAAKELRKVGYKYVWCRHGKVFAKKSEGEKVCVIKSESDVTALSG